MRIDVRGVPLGGWCYSKVKKSGKQVKINGPTSNKESGLATCATGAEREGNSTIIHQRLAQFPQRPSPLLNPGTYFRDSSFRSCGAHGLRYPFRMRYDEGRVSRPAPRSAIMTYSRCRGFMANCEKGGNALMRTKGQRETRQYPQSWGNLALADESLGVLQPPKAKTRSTRLSVVPDITEEEVDALAATTGILNGIRLSLTLWSLIGIIILLIGKLLAF